MLKLTSNITSQDHRIKTLILAASLSFVPVYGIDAAVALSAKPAYNIAQVRSHQFVETWTSLRGNRIHVRAHVANETGGLFKGPFNPIVTLSFRNTQGKEIARGQLIYSIGASQKDKWFDSDLPLVNSALWGATARIVASAADSSYTSPPPPTWPVTPPIHF